MSNQNQQNDHLRDDIQANLDRFNSEKLLYDQNQHQNNQHQQHAPHRNSNYRQHRVDLYQNNLRHGHGHDRGHHGQHNNNNNNNNISGYVGNQYNDRFNKQEYGQVNYNIFQHYNNRSNSTRSERQESKIIKMRSINNWIKSVLIQLYTASGHRVLDICGGKLGDLQKWVKQSIGRLYVSDIALDSLRHGMARLNEELAKRNSLTFDTTFICCDCFSPKLLESMPPATSKVDLVSCQFALHYSFRSEESARQMLLNVTSLLANGGHFIGTLPDACYIVKKCRESKSNKIGNGLYSIEFKPSSIKSGGDSNEIELDLKKFGCAYDFFLQDAIDGLEEYLVHIDVLAELALEYDLDLVMDQTFHDFFENNYDENRQLFQRMNRSNTISQEEWEALSIYRVFAFKKRGTATTPTPPKPTSTFVYKESDIIINL